MAPSSVDKSIHPTATGRALVTATAHTAPNDLKAYFSWFCPFVQRSWVTLLEKRIPHQYIEINPYHKAADFLALNPRGLVPTVGVSVPGRRGAKPLYESLVVAEYLDERYGDEAVYGPRLLPAGDGEVAAYERARCRLWIDHVSSRVVPGFYRVLQHTVESQYSLEEAREQLLGGLRTFFAEVVGLDGEREEVGGEGGPWFLGKQMSLVDITLVPWAVRLFLIEHYKEGGVGIPKEGEGGENEKIWARWRVWEKAVQERQSVIDTMSEREKYIEVYKRYAEDKTGSQVGQATRGGSRLP